MAVVREPHFYFRLGEASGREGEGVGGGEGEEGATFAAGEKLAYTRLQSPPSLPPL